MAKLETNFGKELAFFFWFWNCEFLFFVITEEKKNWAGNGYQFNAIC